VGEPTLTDVFADRGDGSVGLSQRTVLTLAFRANGPFEPPSRHVLGAIDCVTFGRGSRAAVRDERDGLRRLVLRVPDPMMSTDHGRLLHVRGRWRLDDPRSKNGAVVAGQPTRHAMLRPGDIFELGHTLFLFETADLPSDVPLDAFPAGVDAAGGLETLHHGLGREIALLVRVAAAEVPVLLLGETGTGKEIFARAVHALSGRRGPFVAVNCGGLAAGLMEAELFGHRRGAFSGAVSDRPGYLRSADRGTLFLDEVAELSPAAQAALLRALQQREVVPVGDASPTAIDIRLVAATHRDLAEMVGRGAFREDLHARLQGLTVSLPPLRERRCDIGVLIASLLRRLGGGDEVRFVPAAAYALFRNPWPHNVRGLERCLETALALAAGRPIAVEHLRLGVPVPEAAVPAAAATAMMATPERDRLAELMLANRGNVSAVARALETSRSQVRRLLARHGIAVANGASDDED